MDDQKARLMGLVFAKGAILSLTGNSSRSPGMSLEAMERNRVQSLLHPVLSSADRQ